MTYSLVIQKFASLLRQQLKQMKKYTDRWFINISVHINMYHVYKMQIPRLLQPKN